MYHFLQSELLSRRLAHFCCKRIAILFNDFTQSQFDKAIKQLQSQTITTTTTTTTTSTTSTSSTTVTQQHYIIHNEMPFNGVRSLFSRISQCPMHNEMLRSMLSIVYAVQLGCMQALVWNRLEVGGGPYNGSPLDFLPCAPSQLVRVLAPSEDEDDDDWCEYTRRELERAELCIRRRSMAIENRWATDKLRPASIAIVQMKIIAVLETLDKMCYDLCDVNETVDSLYEQIFPKLNLVPSKKKKVDTVVDNKENEASTSVSDKQNGEEQSGNEEDSAPGDDSNPDEIDDEIKRPLSDREIIFLLCDWATTTRRSGLHRIFYVVFLIKKRQIDLITQVKEANKQIRNVCLTKLKVYLFTF